MMGLNDGKASNNLALYMFSWSLCSLFGRPLSVGHNGPRHVSRFLQPDRHAGWFGGCQSIAQRNAMRQWQAEVEAANAGHCCRTRAAQRSFYCLTPVKTLILHQDDSSFHSRGSTAALFCRIPSIARLLCCSVAEHPRCCCQVPALIHSPSEHRSDQKQDKRNDRCRATRTMGTRDADKSRRGTGDRS